MFFTGSAIRFNEVDAKGNIVIKDAIKELHKPTAKEILYSHATKNNDGLMSGQVRWIVEAMEEYAKFYGSKVIYEKVNRPFPEPPL